MRLKEKPTMWFTQKSWSPQAMSYISAILYFPVLEFVCQHFHLDEVQRLDGIYLKFFVVNFMVVWSKATIKQNSIISFCD